MKSPLPMSGSWLKSCERDEHNGVICKDVCNPITAEFREELYDNILEAYEQVVAKTADQTKVQDKDGYMKVFGEPLPFR